MKYTFFVLDFDGTYDNEPEWSDGVQPVVYLIPLDKVDEIRKYAEQAHDEFHAEEESCCWGIGDYFDAILKSNNIDFKEVGRIDLTFEERQEDYLADYIPREFV